MINSASPSASPEGVLAPRSIDHVRVLRRSIRCVLYGLIGLVPWVGLGLALQAVQLQRLASAELGERWNTRAVSYFWPASLFVVWMTDSWAGPAGDLVVCVFLLVTQSALLWRTFPRSPGTRWPPGAWERLWGTILAWAGISLSLWLTVLLIRWLATQEPSG